MSTPHPYEVPLGSQAPFELASSTGSAITLEQRRLLSSDDDDGRPPPFVYRLDVVGPDMVRVRLGRKGRDGVLQNNLKPDLPTYAFDALEIDEKNKVARFKLPDGVSGTLAFSACPQLTIVDSAGRNLHADHPLQPFSILPAAGRREGGLAWYSKQPLEDVAMGLGEKAAPINLAHRRWELRATNASHYSADASDPLYKKLDFLLLLPNPLDPVRKRFKAAHPDAPPPRAVGVYTPSNSTAIWDLGHSLNDPTGELKSFTQTEGPLDIFLSWGASGVEVKRGWRSLLKGDGGRAMLAGRSWLGYLASTMGQAESDNPPAQELLTQFPEKCRQHGIPCSGMHLSSGYTVDKETGFRFVFNWNRERYPDFEALMRTYHESGIRVCANIKPYVSSKHPSYERLRAAGALFRDPATGEHSTTLVWSGLFEENFAGSWVDMTSKAGREWWAQGVKSLIDRGVDSIWNDDNEYTITSSSHECAWEMPDDFTAPGSPGPKSVGQSGGLVSCEMVGLVSKTVLERELPDRRPFVLSRSLNVGALQHVNSSWSGDNVTSFKTMRCQIAIGLNSSVAFLHSYGDDIGGFAGPLPTPELFVRWCQASVYRSRFCIHSFKPTPDSPTGGGEINEPWMYTEVLPIVRSAIERRYEIIPYLYALMWEAAEEGHAPMTWSGWGPFERDPNVYEEEVLDGQDFWAGTGRVLVAGCYWKGTLERKVYLPSCALSGEPDEGYYDLYTGGFHAAGSTVTTPTPLETIATFVRAGTVIPIGKPCVTITSASGLPSTTADGTRIRLRSEGGVVELDDWRGVEIFPPPAGEKTGRWSFAWTEDDGESHLDGLATSRVRLTYSTEEDDNEVIVTASWLKDEFQTLWTTLWVTLPKGDVRVVAGGEEEVVRGRRGWRIPISG